MTSFFTWNLRGFNQTRKHEVLRDWVRKKKPHFGILLETRVQQEKYEGFCQVALP